MICNYCKILYEPSHKAQRFCSAACGAKSTGETITKKYREKYYSNPKLCKYCSKPIPYEKRTDNVFCNSSCSALYSNPKRRKKTYTIKCIECEKETQVSSKNGRFCSIECQIAYRKNKIIIPRIIAGEAKSNVSIKSYLEVIYGYKCFRCGINEWNGEHLTLQLDHIDGNSDDNRLSNVRLLCPNCHSLTPTYKGGNKAKLKDTKRNRMHREIYARKTARQ